MAGLGQGIMAHHNKNNAYIGNSVTNNSIQVNSLVNIPGMNQI
jgi:hypothetical protein